MAAGRTTRNERQNRKFARAGVIAPAQEAGLQHRRPIFSQSPGNVRAAYAHVRGTGTALPS
jgi:hypothetical protein